jgi:8-amino-7-oxononanoate synthase
VLDAFQDALDSLGRDGRRRHLRPPLGIDFSSNDYLGLSGHDGIRRSLIEALQGGIALGAGGSRLLRGNHPEHEALEAFAADYFGTGAALFMATGYLANLSLFSALPSRGDGIAFDERIHASAKEGIRAGHARKTAFAHNDAQACEDAVKRLRAQGAKAVWIAVESVYSMDGDAAPLADLMDLADRLDAFLVVDEAHATGVWGPAGKGLAAELEGRDNLISLHTGGKALGQAGALLTLAPVLKETLLNRARAFVYTTAPPPLAAVAYRCALEVVRDEPERREVLHGLIAHARAAFPDAPGDSQIVPLIVGDDAAAARKAERLQARGFDIRAIRTPTVPQGTARLRLSVTLNASRPDIDALATAMQEAA